MSSIQSLNRFFLFFSAPFIGIMCGIVFMINMEDVAQVSTSAPIVLEPSEAYQANLTGLQKSVELAKVAGEKIEQSYAKYDESNALIASILPLIKSNMEYPARIYDNYLSSLLGKPSATIDTKRLKAQLYYKSNSNFKSYLVKIKLKSDDAMDLVLGGSEPGKVMTTKQAAKNHGAAVAINAGGFADSNNLRYPIGTTIIDGKYVNGFQPSKNELFFVGLNDHNELIGGIFNKKDELDDLNPKFGASFVPVLIQDGKSKTIPSKWKTSPLRAPRVVIANFKDDQLLILVTDGYNTKGSAGATLTEIQKILLGYDIKDAYNLDGGGSASLIFNGNLINNPSDGVLRQLPTHFLFYR